MRRSWQHDLAFSRAGRSGGRSALQFPRASNSRGSSHSASLPSAHRRSRKFPLWFFPRPSAEVGNFRVGTAFLHPKRSGGRPALQFPRATFSHRRSVFRPNPDHMLQGGKEKKRRTGNSDATPLIRWGGTPLRLSPA